MASKTQARRRRARGAFALARLRLRAAWGVRAARVLAVVTALGFGVAALVLRAGDGAALGGLPVVAVQCLGWLAGAPIALAAAEDLRAQDRRDGIVALAAPRGTSPSALVSARTFAAMTEIAFVIGAPALVLSLFTAALAARPGVALARVGLGLGAASFAVVAGVVLGGLGAACARVGGPRGRLLLMAVVLLPWALADLTGHGGWSIPGALGAVLDAVMVAR